jgi:hypothetical protein
VAADLIRLALIAEVVILGVIVAAMAGLAGRRWMTRRRGDLRVAARQGLFGAIVSADPTSAVEAFAALGPDERDDILCSTAVGLEGGPDTVFPALAEALGTSGRIGLDLADRRWWRRLAAVRRMSVLGLDEPNAEHLAVDPAPQVRAAVAEWLGTTGSRPRAEATALTLVGLLADPDYRVRRSAGEALWRLGSAALPGLRRALGADDEDLRAAAARVIGAVGGVPASELLADLPDPGDTRARARILGVIGSSPAPRDRRLISLCIEDPDPEVRRAAVLAAGRAGMVELAGPIASRVQAAAGACREAAMRSLDHMGPVGELLVRHSTRNGRSGA